MSILCWSSQGEWSVFPSPVHQVSTLIVWMTILLATTADTPNLSLHHKPNYQDFVTDKNWSRRTRSDYPHVRWLIQPKVGMQMIERYL
mmetsp:Transcript_13861/g.15234  ORF Transcript_13861/g.15234 Transcript_13861/m.15234 type:complete len:88 (+) Transcript_13861:384-647(+)